MSKPLARISYRRIWKNGECGETAELVRCEELGYKWVVVTDSGRFETAKAGMMLCRLLLRGVGAIEEAGTRVYGFGDKYPLVELTGIDKPLPRSELDKFKLWTAVESL